MTLILLQSSKTFLLSRGDTIFVRNTQMVLQEMRRSLFTLVVIEEMELLKPILKEFPGTAVAVVPLIGHITHAVEAISQGAIDYGVGPVTDLYLDKLLSKVTHVKKREICALQGEQGHTNSPIIAESVAMKKILIDSQKIASSHASVFICGESGTGKEVIASYIHHASSRHLHPFIKVNCAAIPESLVESEFFGHEKGAFTGALDKRIGRFEMAHLGTLLLDEVSEIPLLLQSKLLRVLQEQEFERVGGVKSLKVNVRLIATSNRSMKAMIGQKTFREDLYFRLNVIPLYLPPLRERKEDIIPLARAFLARSCSKTSPRKKLSSQAEKFLLDYPWPGNVRELSNVIERATVMHSKDTLEHHHLFFDQEATTKHQEPPSQTLAEMEKLHILATLAKCQYNRTLAAKMLGINIRTLRTKILEYQVHKIGT
ncbi:sigma-54 dependent transcriptional regulator [Rhabdochlamydiaceae symbiont of Dictyostelium giganteum]|uniref:sigma-54 dependent transcriptional regulator n=1 Tax=Rhabdochlamydiaceae symbiont of Dictyostelium giganteum TaxID=3342349 RepID=UPI00384D9D96